LAVIYGDFGFIIGESIMKSQLLSGLDTGVRLYIIGDGFDLSGKLLSKIPSL
jgi:hypothetical protein